jgi:hypothetical protein
MAGRFGDAAPLYCGVVSNSTTGLVMAASRRRAWPSRFLLRGPAVIFDALAFFCRLVAGITTAVSDLSSHTQHRPLLLVESNAKPHEVQYCLGRWRARGEQRGRENKGDKSQYRSSEAWSRTTCSTTSSWGRAWKGGTTTSASCSCCPAPNAKAHLPRQRYLPDPTCKKAEIGSVLTKIIASPCGVTRCEGAGRARMGPADANLQNHMVQSVHLCSRGASAANLRRGSSFSIWCVGRCAATSRDRQDC